MKKTITKKVSPIKKVTKKVATKKISSIPAIKSKKQSNIFVEEVGKHFIASDDVCYTYSLGKLVANSLSGFLAGMIVTSLIWAVVINVFYTN